MLLHGKITWSEVCKDRQLQDLPFKIELNGFNQIVMSPTHARHSRLQAKILRLLNELLPEGEAMPELAVETDDNVKVPDVIWASAQVVQSHLDEPSWSTCPEICVEVLSPANTGAEMQKKRCLYFARGAEEVWSCDWNGRMTFYDRTGELDMSRLCTRFPDRVTL